MKLAALLRLTELPCEIQRDLKSYSCGEGASRRGVWRQSEEKRDFIAHKNRERRGRGLSSQANAFAEAKAEEKVGLLGSVPKNHPGRKMRE